MTIEYRQYVPDTYLASDGLARAEDVVRQNLSASAHEHDDSSAFYDEVRITYENGHAPGCSDTKEDSRTGVWICGVLDRQPLCHINSTPQGRGKAAKLAAPRELSPEEFERHMATKSKEQNAT